MAGPPPTPKGQVAAVAPDGTPILIPKSALAETKMGGGRAMGAKEEAQTRRDIELDQEFNTGVGGTLEGLVLPPLAGVARGLSLGMSDPAFVEAASAFGPGARDAVRRRLSDYTEFAPAASTAGELAGIAGGALMGDEAGLANLPGLISRGGRAIEGVAGRALGEGLAGRVVGGAVAAAAENAVYSAGKAASDATLRDEDLTGEMLVAATKNGAIFGGGLGAALGGAGFVGGRVLSGLRGSGRAATEGAEAVVGAEARAGKGSLADYLEKSSDVKTIKALGGSAGDLRALEDRVPGGYRRVAQDIRADVEASTGQSIGFHSKESLHEYATARKEELGKKLGGMLEKLDELKTGIAPDREALLSRVSKEILEPKHIRGVADPVTGLTKPATPLPGQEKSINAVKDWSERIFNAFEERAPTFSEWQKIRVGLDKDIYQGTVKASPKVESLRQLRAIIEDELEVSGERAAKAAGESFQDQYQATKKLYQSVTKAEELTERGVSRQLANNSFGLGATMGALTGVATGGPVTGIAMGLAGKFVKDRGDMLAADLLQRGATMLGASRVAGKVTSELQSGVRRLLPGSSEVVLERVADGGRAAKTALGVTLSGNQRADYSKLSQQITSATTRPEATIERLSRSTGDLGDHAPKATAAVVSTSLRGLQFLQEKLPPPRNDPYSLQPQLTGKPGGRVSDAEISKFMRYAQAVDDPLIVLREAKNGSLSRDHVEAVKAVYPKMYAEIQSAVMQGLVSSKTELPYGARIQLGILLDIPTDKTLSPEFQRAIQATYTSAEQAGEESPSPIVDAPNLAGSLQTATQGASERAM